jgi:hypothetical protein
MSAPGYWGTETKNESKDLTATNRVRAVPGRTFQTLLQEKRTVWGGQLLLFR